MTTSPDPDNPDTEGSTLPPYEGRRESADVDGQEVSTKDGAKVAGATGPVADDAQKAADPADTDRGAVASPADEQPATESGGAGSDPGTTGSSHVEGTPRGEDSGA